MHLQLGYDSRVYGSRDKWEEKLEDLLEDMLATEMCDRISAAKALQHEYFEGFQERYTLIDEEGNRPLQSNPLTMEELMVDYFSTF